MSKDLFIITATASSFAQVPVGTHIGTITFAEPVYTNPEKSKSPWKDSALQVKYTLKCDAGTAFYFSNMQGFLHAGDTEEIDLLLKNMSLDKIQAAGLTAAKYKAMSRDAKYNAMFEEVPSDQYNGEKKPYLLFKHGMTRILSDKNTQMAKEITGRIPVMAGVAEEGDSVNILTCCIGAQIGFEVVDGPNGSTKVKNLMTVEKASA